MRDRKSRESLPGQKKPLPGEKRLRNGEQKDVLVVLKDHSAGLPVPPMGRRRGQAGPELLLGGKRLLLGMKELLIDEKDLLFDE